MIRYLLPILLLTCTLPVLASDPPAKPTPSQLAPAPPPPGMDDVGVAPGIATSAASTTAPTNDDAMAPPDSPDTRPVRDKATRDAEKATEQAASTNEPVVIRKQGDDTVEEYRDHGHLWMIRIIPQHGPTQTFIDPNGSGRLIRDPDQGPVAPVYFTLYQWQ